MSRPSSRRSADRISRGRWMIERERCRIEDPRPPPPDPGGRMLAPGVEQALKRLGLEQASWAATLEEQWPDLVGPDVARHSRPGVLRGSELIVYVDGSVWLNELQRFAMTAMLSAIQAKIGKIRVRALRFQLDPDR